MSLVDGELAGGEGGVSFVSPDLRLTLGAPAAIGLREGTFPRVALGVRAEDVRVHANGSAPDPAARSRRPCSCWSRSGRTRSWSSPTGDATVVARVAPDAGLAIGQTVTAELTPGRIHLFEREQGERIVA